MYLTIQSPNVSEFLDRRNNHVFCSAERERMSADLKGTSAYAALQQCDVTFRWSTSKHILSTRLKLWWILQQASRARKKGGKMTSYINSLIVCFGNQATRWFFFVRQAKLWHLERKSTAIFCRLPSGTVVAAGSWFVIVSPFCLHRYLA